MAHREIMALDDAGLSRGMILISRHKLFADLSLTPWERNFIWETPDWWVRAGGFTWKQRKIARRILSSLTEELERRKELGDWVAEARGEEPVPE